MPSHHPILLLDVMNTLVYDPFYVEVPAFFGLSLDELLHQKHPTAWLEFEIDSSDEAAFLPRFFSDGRDVDGEGLKAMMKRAYRWLDGMEDLLRDLRRAAVEMHALSNYPVWYRMIESRLQLSRFMSWRFVSCKTAVRKPDPEAYLGAAQALGVPLSRCLFVDDRAKNCEAAQAVGMASIVFTDAPTLRAELAARGCLLSSPRASS
ncbi:MAG: HAD family phosphatase [bacterium]